MIVAAEALYEVLSSTGGPPMARRLPPRDRDGRFRKTKRTKSRRRR